MEMDVPPAAVDALPDARLHVGRGRRRPVRADALHQPLTDDDGHVAHDADVRGAHGGLVAAADAAEVEVEAVEGQSFDDLAVRLRLDGRQRRDRTTPDRRPSRRRRCNPAGAGSGTAVLVLTSDMIVLLKAASGRREPADSGSSRRRYTTSAGSRRPLAAPQFLEQPGQLRELIMGVQPAGIGQHPGERAAEPLRPATRSRRPAGSGRCGRR